MVELKYISNYSLDESILPEMSYQPARLRINWHLFDKNVK